MSKKLLLLLLVLLCVSLVSAKRTDFSDLPEVSSDLPFCVDGTHFGFCSDDGFFCKQGDLVPRCSKCGCPDRFVCDNDFSKWGTCMEIVCFSDSECNEPGNVGNFFCQDNDVYQDYATFACLNPGTTDSSCASEVSAVLIDECDSNEECIDGECQVKGPEVLYYDTFTDEDNTWLSDHSSDVGGLFYEAISHETDPTFENQIFSNEMVSTAAGWKQYGMTQYNLAESGVIIQPGDSFSFDAYCASVGEYKANGIALESSVNDQALFLRACGREDYYLVHNGVRHEFSSGIAGKWSRWIVNFIDPSHVDIRVYRDDVLVGELNNLALKNGKQLSDINVIYYISLQNAVIDNVKLIRSGSATPPEYLFDNREGEMTNEYCSRSTEQVLSGEYSLFCEADDEDGVIGEMFDNTAEAYACEWQIYQTKFTGGIGHDGVALSSDGLYYTGVYVTRHGNSPSNKDFMSIYDGSWNSNVLGDFPMNEWVHVKVEHFADNSFVVHKNGQTYSGSRDFTTKALVFKAGGSGIAGTPGLTAFYLDEMVCYKTS